MTGRSLRVAYDHQVFVEQRGGGVLRYFSELIARLAAFHANEVAVVAPFHASTQLASERLRKFARGIHVPLHFRGADRLRGLANRLATPLAWSRLNADIVHETYYSLQPIGRARRRIVTIHDMIPELFPADFGAGSTLSAAKLAAVQRADHIICVSQNTKEDLLRLFGVSAASVTVVPLGHELPGDRAPCQPATTSDDDRPLKPDRPVILYVGRRDGYKNFAALLQAYAHSRALRSETTCLAFGGGPFTLRERAEMTALGVERCFSQRSGDDTELIAAYRSATALVYPSLYEGFGIPPLEAMARGCPVVCSNVSSIPEVVGEAGLYFDPRRPDELQRALETALANTSLLQDLSHRGLRRSELFSWNRCALETSRVYGTVSGREAAYEGWRASAPAVLK